MDALKLIAQDSLKAEAPKLNVGDTVKVHVRIAEGDKFRIQIFEGTVIAKKHGGVSETFTVRRVAHGCGIERVFPLHSPTVEKVEIVREGKVRRAKLYYLRDRVGKAAKVKSKIKDLTSFPHRIFKAVAYCHCVNSIFYSEGTHYGRKELD